MNRSIRTSAPRLRLCTLRQCAVALVCLFGARPLAAQVPDSARIASGDDVVYEVRLEDGSVLIGRFVAVEGPSVVLVTQGGLRLELRRAQIREARAVRGSVQANGEIWPEDPNRTRLFFGPTGRNLRAGEGYFGMFEAVFPFVAGGLTDYFTIAGGTPIVPEWIGEVLYLAPRLQIVDTERVQLSASALAFFDLTGDADHDSFGLLFGAGTFGSSDHAISVGAGWGFAGDEMSNEPALMLGAETRLNRSIKLITENYYVSFDTDDVLLFGAGVRIFGERMTGDVGLGFGAGNTDFECCLPLVNFVYHFGSAP